MTSEELEEIAQDAVTTALEKLGSFDGSSTLETWLYAYGSFHYANAYRKKLRHNSKRSSRPFEDVVAELESNPGVDRSSDRIEIEHALDKLGPPVNLIIRKRCFEEVPFEEIARQLGEKEATVKTWFYRGLRELGAKLREGGSAL